MNTNTQIQNVIEQDKETLVSAQVEKSHYYSEVNSGSAVFEKDILSQFRMNLNQLEDLHGRMKFLMTEVSSVIKKRS